MANKATAKRRASQKPQARGTAYIKAQFGLRPLLYCFWLLPTQNESKHTKKKPCYSTIFARALERLSHVIDFLIIKPVAPHINIIGLQCAWLILAPTSVAIINTSDLGGDGEPDCGPKGERTKAVSARTSLLYA